MLFATLAQALAFLHGVASQLESILWHHWSIQNFIIASDDMFCTLQLRLLSLSIVVANIATSACLVFLLHPDNRKCGGKGEKDYIRELSEFGLWRKFFVPIHNVGL